MNNFKKLQTMSVDELTEWLDENGQWDNSPWSLWFDLKYCQQCEPIKAMTEDYFGCRECAFAFCELEKKCRYFQEMDEEPDSKDIIKLWLEAEVEE